MGVCLLTANYCPIMPLLEIFFQSYPAEIVSAGNRSCTRRQGKQHPRSSVGVSDRIIPAMKPECPAPAANSAGTLAPHTPMMQQCDFPMKTAGKLARPILPVLSRQK